MENLISTTYDVIGMKEGDSATILQKILTDIEGVISVKIDTEKKQLQITSKEIFDIELLQKATVNTDYYISEPLPNDSLDLLHNNTEDSIKHKHNALRDLDGGGNDDFVNA